MKMHKNAAKNDIFDEIWLSGRTQPGQPATGRIIYTKKIWEKLTVLGETDSYSEVDIDLTGEPTTASSSLSKNQTKRSLQ